MQTNLSFEIIESYNFKKRTYKPDWDDTSVEYELPNGLLLTTMTQCFNEPCDSDSLEGLDGFIYIVSKEELDTLINQSFEDVCKTIAEKDANFDIEEYI